MGVSHEESWHTATNPRHLLRLSRVRPNGRKYLLLACAVVRHLVPGSRTDLGTRILDELERFAVVQPAKGVTAHLWREVVRRRIPEVPDARPFTQRQFGDDTAWVQQFAGRLASLSQVFTAEVNVIFEIAFAPVKSLATQDAYREAQEIAARVMLGKTSTPVGWFSRLLGRATSLTPKLRADAALFRDEVIARLPAEKRNRVQAQWPSATARPYAWQRGLMYLTAEREEQRFAEVNAKACALVREVFGNPFRPPVIDPSWLAWNFGAVRHIAEQIAATGNFADTPILGDALEDAGCQDERLLRHCRGETTHVPGCWALDAVLGR